MKKKKKKMENILLLLTMLGLWWWGAPCAPFFFNVTKKVETSVYLSPRKSDYDRSMKIRCL